MVPAMLCALHCGNRVRAPSCAGGAPLDAKCCIVRCLPTSNHVQVYPVLLLYTALGWLALLS